MGTEQDRWVEEDVLLRFKALNRYSPGENVENHGKSWSG